MLEIIRSFLAKAQLARCDCTEISVPDAGVTGLVALLRSVGVPVLGALAVSEVYERVYPSSDLQMDDLPSFYESGFRDMRRTNSLGLSSV